HTAPISIYTLSLHDALPISVRLKSLRFGHWLRGSLNRGDRDRRSKLHLIGTMLHQLHPSLGLTLLGKIFALYLLGYIERYRVRRSEEYRLNSSHVSISYAVF